MLPKKTKRNNRSKKSRLLFFGFCIFFSIIVVFLIYSVFFVKKSLFISPVTNDNIEEKKLEKLLSDAQIAFVSVTPLQDSYRVELMDGGEVIISFKKNIAKQITSLQPILKQLTIDSRMFNRIDFRFDKPLVVYE